MSIDPTFVESTADDVVGKYSYKMRDFLIHVVENKPLHARGGTLNKLRSQDPGLVSNFSPLQRLCLIFISPKNLHKSSTFINIIVKNIIVAIRRRHVL